MPALNKSAKIHTGENPAASGVGTWHREIRCR